MKKNPKSLARNQNSITATPVPQIVGKWVFLVGRSMHNDRVGVRDMKREKRGADSWDLPQHQLYSHLEMACPPTHYDFQLQTIELAYICN